MIESHILTWLPASVLWEKSPGRGCQTPTAGTPPTVVMDHRAMHGRPSFDFFRRILAPFAFCDSLGFLAAEMPREASTRPWAKEDANDLI